MPVNWTPENDRRLLLLVLELTKVNNADIAKRWSEKYVGEGEQPTARAISERLYKLKNVAGSGKANSSPSTPRKAASTPSKITKKQFRTPTSNSKKRKIQSSDEEPSMSEGKSDSEAEQKYIDPAITPRRSISRSTKKAQSYAEESDEAGPAPKTSDDQFLNGVAKENGSDDGNISDGSDFGTFT